MYEAPESGYGANDGGEALAQTPTADLEFRYGLFQVLAE
jgi:hypothetical protein